MELLEYLIQLRGGAVTSAELKGIRDQFVEVGAAARDAGKASAEGTAAAAGKGKGAAAGGFGAAVGKIAKVGAVGLVALGFEAVKMSNTFQTEMLRIRTEGGATTQEFNQMRKGVLALAASGQSFGQGPVSLAKGLYHLESMGIRGKQALLGLRLASAEAAISGAHLEDTTTSLGGALFIAAKGTRGITGTMGALNAIAGAGNMRFQELNDALGTGLLGSAKIAGISLQETGAALATLTDSGYKASSAGAQLGTALHFLYSPTKKAETALASINLSGNKLATDLRKPQGILMALRDLRAHMAGMKPNDVANVLNSILPGGRGRVLLNLYQLQDRLAPKYQQIRGTENDFGKHMSEQALNPTTKMHVAVAKLQAELVLLGDAVTKYVTPAFTFLAGALAKLLSGLLAAFTWFTKMSPGAKALATFIGLVTVAFVGLRVAEYAATVAMGLFNAVMDANPISLVIIAIAGLVAGIVYAYNKVGWFRNLVNAVWGWLRGAVVGTVNFIGKHWQLLGSILGGPFVALAIFIGGHFKQVKTVVVGIVNFIIGMVNTVIRAIDSINVTVPSWVPVFGGDHFGFNIGQIGTIGSGGGGGGGGQAKTAGRTTPGSTWHAGHRYAGAAAQVTHHFASNQLSQAQARPAMVHGDIVVKVRHQELARITRKQLHDSMMG